MMDNLIEKSREQTRILENNLFDDLKRLCTETVKANKTISEVINLKRKKKATLFLCDNSITPIKFWMLPVSEIEKVCSVIESAEDDPDYYLVYVAGNTSGYNHISNSRLSGLLSVLPAPEWENKTK